MKIYPKRHCGLYEQYQLLLSCTSFRLAVAGSAQDRKRKKTWFSCPLMCFFILRCASFNDTNSTGWKLHWYGRTASTVNGVISVIGKELFHNPPFVEQLGNVAWAHHAWIEPFSNYIIKGVSGLRGMGGWLSPQNVLEKNGFVYVILFSRSSLSLSLSRSHRDVNTQCPGIEAMVPEFQGMGYLC